jgi:hypothetical protein
MEFLENYRSNCEDCVLQMPHLRTTVQTFHYEPDEQKSLERPFKYEDESLL